MKLPVLVLNANFEPIHVCDTRRAICLILSDKAKLVLDSRGEIKTISRSYPLPSVIRLEKMIKRPRLRIRLTRHEVFRRDNFTCQYCGKHGAEMTIDHVIPRHLGGRHIWTNVVTACPTCNHHKGGRSLEDAHMRLLHPPREPSASVGYIFGRHLTDYAEWEPFISGW